MRFIGSAESNLELDVTRFDVLSITDFNEGVCSVTVRLWNDEANAVWIHTYPDFEYQNDTWSTQDAIDFVTNKLTL
jgi:hypothetical protein